MSKKKNNRFIVKVQLPLFGRSKAPVLIYNEDRSVEEMFDLTVAQYRELEQAMDGEPKEFFYARIEGGKGLRLVGHAPWQGW